MKHECASTEKRRSARTVKGLASLGSEAQASGRAHKRFSTAAARTGLRRRRDPPNLIHYIGDYMVDYMAPIFLPRASAPRGYSVATRCAAVKKHLCARSLASASAPTGTPIL